MRTTLIYLQIKATMEDGTFVAFCHFLSDLFSSISRFSLLLQRNDVILPQVRETERKGGQEVKDFFASSLNMFFICK